MAYIILGKYGNRSPEEIDSFETLQEAEYNLREYRLAFGSGWSLWISKKNPRPKTVLKHQIEPIHVTESRAIKEGLADGFESALHMLDAAFFKELVNDDLLLKAVTAKVLSGGGGDLDKELYAYTTAKNFGIDIVRHMKAVARTKSRQVIAGYTDKLMAGSAAAWREKFKLAKEEFDRVSQEIMASDPRAGRLGPRFQKLPVQFKALDMLVFQGLSVKDVMRELGISNPNVIDQWKIRLTRLMREKGISKTLDEVIKSTKGGVVVAPDSIPTPKSVGAKTRLTPEEREEILALSPQRLGERAIAAAVGRGRKTVRRVLREAKPSYAELIALEALLAGGEPGALRARNPREADKLTLGSLGGLAARTVAGKQKQKCQECGKTTREGKAFCTEHIHRLPYAASLITKIKDIETDDALAESVKDDPEILSQLAESITAEEILNELEQHGPRSLERLALSLNKSIEAVKGYVKALKRDGKVSTKTTRRGYTSVSLVG